MTLGQAKPLLAPFVDGGVCPTDARVIARIDEAQRRLFPLRIFVGTVARYIVLTQTSNGKTYFDIPAPLDTISRVTRYTGDMLVQPPSPLPPVTYGLLTDGVGALVGQTGSFLQLNVDPSNPRRFYVQSGIESVDVAGKKVFVPATTDTSILMINDTQALKLMLLGLWRESNDRPDLGQAFEQKAIERLGMLSDQAVEEARRISYQATANTWGYGTVGYVRAKLATDIKHGVHHDDAMLFELLNKVMDYLIGIKNNFIREKRLGVKDDMPLEDYVFLASDDQELPIDHYPTIKLAAFALLAQNDPQGLQTAQALEQQAQASLELTLKTELADRRFGRYEAEFQKFADYPDTFGYFRTRMALDLPNGLLLSDSELRRAINQAEEWAMTQGKWKGTIQNYRFVVPDSGIIRLPRIVDSVLMASLGDRPAPVWGGDFDFHENGPGYQQACGSACGNRLVDRGMVNGHRQYYVRDFCAPECVHFRVKLRHVNYKEDDEKVAVTNYPAMRKATESFLIPDLNAGIALRKEAEQILSMELTEHQGGNRQSLQVQNVGSFGSIPHIN